MNQEPGLAFLEMYLRDETAAAWQGLWSGIRQRLGYGPIALQPVSDLMGGWLSPDLLLSQTCGYPYRARLWDKVTLIGTPDFGLPGVPPGYYRSVFVALADAPLADFDGENFAYNETLSQSGWAAPVLHMERAGIRPRGFIQSGGHLNSARLVAEGKAGFAAIDAVTWALIKRYEPWADQLREIDETPPSPGLPLIAAAGTDPAPLFDAVKGAIDALSDPDRELLMLRDLVRIETATYRAVPSPELLAPPAVDM